VRALLTTCTALKRADAGLLPAEDRYEGPRVAFARAEADRRGLPLLFLSGVFGVVAADAPLPPYDHALLPDEVAALVPRASAQLRALGVTEIVAVLRAEGTPGWAPYWSALGLAASDAGVAWSPLVVSLD